MRIYNFNYNYFDNIDTEEKAYWLGFLYADGYILSGNNGFGCALKESDKNHLLKFLNNIECSNNSCLKYQEKTKSYKFSLFNEHIHKRLIELGFSSKKSYDNNDIIWNNIPNNFKKDFIRGFWDGDGYISISGEGKNLIGVISNNEKLLEKFCIFLNKELKINNCKVTKSDGYPRIKLFSQIARKVALYLYKDANIFLERKYNKVFELKKPKYNKQYKYIKKLPSERYYIYIPINGKKVTIGTFDTVKEAIEAFNLKAINIGSPIQQYINEDLEKEEEI